MKKSSAFSLIELSIVILVIGILVAGVTQGSRVIKMSRLRTAQGLTKSSPVSGINDLLLWYETSLTTSFDSSVISNGDGSSISTWYDSNTQSSVKNNATTAAGATSPVFKEYIFNSGIPSVRFSGANGLTFDGSLLTGTSFTIFVVEQRSSSSANYFIGGGSYTGTDNDVVIGYGSGTSVKFSTNGTGATNDLSYSSLAAYSTPIARIHTAMLSTLNGRSYWLNGGSSADASNSYTTSLASYGTPLLGMNYTGASTKVYYTGDIAEVIIFRRELKTEERQSVETYLSKKYGVNLANF